MLYIAAALLLEKEPVVSMYSTRSPRIAEATAAVVHSCSAHQCLAITEGPCGVHHVFLQFNLVMTFQPATPVFCQRQARHRIQ